SPPARARHRGSRDGAVPSPRPRSERRRSRDDGRVPRASEPRTQECRGTERAVLSGNPFLLVRLDGVEILPRSEPIDIQGSDQMIGLMKHALSPELVADEREALSGDVIR